MFTVLLFTLAHCCWISNYGETRCVSFFILSKHLEIMVGGKMREEKRGIGGGGGGGG